MQTRVLVSVLHPRYPGLIRWQGDRGARFRDAEDIKRVSDEMIAEAKARYGEDARIHVDTRET